MSVKKKKIKDIILTSTFSLVSTVSVTTVALSRLEWNSSHQLKYYFDGKNFSNYSELSKYIEDNYFNATSIIENRDNWSITKNGKTLYFSDPQILRNEILKEINHLSGRTSLKNISFDSDGGISSNDLSKIHFNNPEITTIYRGKDDSIFNSIEDAKKSYLSIHDAYYFDGTYFRNIEELKLYLDTIYYNNPTASGFQRSNNNAIALLGKNGKYSSPINKEWLLDQSNSLNSINAKKEFINFIKDDLKTYVEFNGNNSKIFYSKNDFAGLATSFNDYDYTKIFSNQGKGAYVVDLLSEDENTLFGPYFVNSTRDIERMSDEKQWKKVKKNDPLITKEIDSAQIAGFLSLIIPEEVFNSNDLESINKQISPINIKALNNQLNIYFQKIRNFNWSLFNDYKNFIELIKSGKNYNSFYSIILSFSWLIDKLIKYKAPESLINDTRFIFNDIAKQIDENIKILIPSSLLYSTKPSEENLSISFERILDFCSKTKDFNTDIQYYVDEISYYSEFINAINIINLANANALSAGGIIPYSFNMLETYLTGTKTYKTNNQSILNETHDNEYEKLWKVFSSTNPNQFYLNLVGNSYQDSLQEQKIKTLCADISSTTSFFNATYKLGFETEKVDLKKYIYDIDTKGFFTGVSITLLEFLSKNIDNIDFESFLLLKLVDRILFFSNSQQGQLIRKHFYSILTPNISDLINEVKVMWNEFVTNKIKIFEDHQMEKIIYYGFSVLNSARLFSYSLSKLNVNDSIMKSYESIIYGENHVPDIKFRSIYSTFANIFGNFEKILKNKGLKFDEMIKSISTFTRFVGKIGSSISRFIPYVNLAFIVFDILSGAFPKTQEFSYVFETNNGIKYIWNGGLETRAFWGLREVGKDKTINNMKLLKPQIITSAYSSEGYYYNGKIYETLDKVKTIQLLDILNGDYLPLNNSHLKLLYSFDEIKTNTPLTLRPNNVFEKIGDINSCTITNDINSINDVISYVYNNVAFDLKNQKQQGKYFSQMFSFANGHVANDPTQSKEILIDYVVENIKPIKIAQLPIILNGKPNYNGYELDEYSLPFNYWTTNGGVKYNLKDNQYIIYDSNVLPTSSNNLNLDEASIIANIENRFFEMFDVESKEVIKDEIKLVSSFTDLNNYINNIDIYVVNDTNQEGVKKYFLDSATAMNYLLTKYDFTVYSKIQEISTYKLKNSPKIFYSKDELIEWAIREKEIKYE